MSHIDRTVTNRDVIPVLSSTVFADSPDTRFACGLIAENDVPMPGLAEEYHAHFFLRRKVYVDQTGQLDESDIQEDGTDRDADDARSVAFAIFENHEEGVRVVGVSRLIIRGEGTPLPVEDFCPDSFSSVPLDARSVEVSRVIARHETAVVQDLIQWHLFAVMLAYIANHDLGRTFAIIEPWLERHLQGIISISRIGEPRYVEHYLDFNLPIEIDLAGSAEQVDLRNQGCIDAYRTAEPLLTHFGRAVRRSRAARVS